MAEKNNSAGISVPIIGDEVDKYYLNKVWLSDQGSSKTKSSSPIISPSGSIPIPEDPNDPNDPDPEDPPKPAPKRPQLDDIQRPVGQVIYYENGIAKVRVTIRAYISADSPVKRFKVASTKPISQGGTP
ncbi:MAG: hypothetical protein ACO3UU_06810 [Minisyncoccia bacterium]